MCPAPDPALLAQPADLAERNHRKGYGGKLADPAVRRERGAKGGRSRTTPEYHVRKIRELVDRTRAEQGLPPHVTDPMTLSTVAGILGLPTAVGDDEAGGTAT